MTQYKHLNLSDRKKIYKHLKKGESTRQIARRLGRSPSTISRELRRVRKGAYRPELAQKRYEEKRGSR